MWPKIKSFFNPIRTLLPKPLKKYFVFAIREQKVRKAYLIKIYVTLLINILSIGFVFYYVIPHVLENSDHAELKLIAIALSYAAAYSELWYKFSSFKLKHERHVMTREHRKKIRKLEEAEVA